jgi:uncharacterized protein (DUF1684 family)
LFSAGLWSLGAVPALAQQAAIASVNFDEAAWSRDLAAWRAERAREVAASDGWLTLVGLEWLKPGSNSFGGAVDNKILIRGVAPEHMGLLTLSSKSLAGKNAPIIQLLSPAGGFPPELTVDGRPAREGQLTGTNAKPPIIAWHGITLAVLARGDRFAVRIKDADAPTRTLFHGLNWYAPNPRFRVTARWTPFYSPRVEKIPNGMGGTLDLPAPGVAEFTLDGQALHLVPVIEGHDKQTLFFILRDPTGQSTTYKTARFLHTGLPDHGLDQPGTLTLDFNRLENPACAYTSYANCPQPPELNQLPVAIEAGEQLYGQ